MTKLSVKKIIGGLFLFGLVSALALPCLAQQAGTYDASAFQAQSGLNTSADTAGYAVGAQASSIQDLVGKAVYSLLTFVGVIFLGLIIYGAFTWMTAEGNEQKVEQANKILMGALLGFVIVISAYAITYFILNYFWK